MDTIFPACNTLEDDRFESIAEFKDCIGRGDEIEFEWKGVHFGMSGCQPKPEHRIMAYLWNQPDTEQYFDTPDDALEYIVAGDRLRDIIAWLDFVVHTVDSSLVDEWERAGEGRGADAVPPSEEDAVVRDRRGVTVLVRNALFRRVSIASRDSLEGPIPFDAAVELGRLDAEWGFAQRRWRDALDAFFEEHQGIVIDGDARSASYLALDEADEKTDHVWHAVQTFKDEEGDRDFAIVADVDLDATQEEGEAIFKNYRVGFLDELAE